MFVHIYFAIVRYVFKIWNHNFTSAIHSPSPRPGDIRLLGSTVNGAGAVEIYTREEGWTGICPDSDWTDDDAEIICQALGYDTGTATIQPYVCLSQLASCYYR